MPGPVVWAARFGANVNASLTFVPSWVYASGVTLDVEPELDLPMLAGPALSLEMEFDVDGAGPDGAFPGFLAAADDQTLTLDFAFQTSEVGGFIFPFEFDNGGGEEDEATPAPTALADLTDVDFSTPPGDGQFLAYNEVTGFWRPATASGSGGALTSADVTGALGYTPTSITGLTGVKTITQIKTALSLVKGDVGLGQVDNTSDNNKPVSAAQQTALDLKADLADVEAALALKADQGDVDAALALKADTAVVDAALALKADQDDVDAALDLKADQADVDSALALKADQTDVDTALALKADADLVPHTIGELTDVEMGTGDPDAGAVLTWKDGVWQAEAPTGGAMDLSPYATKTYALALAIVFGA